MNKCLFFYTTDSYYSYYSQKTGRYNININSRLNKKLGRTPKDICDPIRPQSTNQ